MSMYKNDINLSLNIGANTQQAQQQIQALQQSLNKIANTNITGKNSIDATQIEKAAASAKELQMHLQNAYNTKTGNLDLSLLNKSIASSKRGIEGLSADLINAGVDGQAAFVNLAKSIAAANQPMMKTNALLDNMWTTLKNTARWEISSSVLRGFESAISNAYRYAQDLNASLNDIRIVTGYNTDKMAEFAVEANNAAKALSTTTTNYTNASLIYFQQGLSDAEVKERTDVTIKMANVSRESAQTVSDQMTSVWNNFADGSHTLEYYADVMTALGAATASSTAEISQGLEKFSAVAESVGLSYEYATSALATITATTRQSADIVGTALKTLFARIQGLNLGETQDDGTSLNKYSEALYKVGINIKDTNGDMKDMDQILDELGAKWGTLSKDVQIATAQTVAGVRQYTQLIALMDNWDFFQQNLTTARGAEGTLNEQAEIYAESWEAARKRVQAALEEIYSELLDDNFFIKLTDTFAILINGIEDLIKGLGGMKGILAIVASVFLSNFAHKIPEALNGAWYNIKVLFGGAKKEAEAFKKDINKIFTETQTNNNFTQSQKVEIIAAQNLMNARYAYEKVSSKLTANEKMQADIRLAALEKEQQQWVDLAQSIEQYQSILKERETSIEGSNLAYQLDRGVNRAWNNQNNYSFDAYTEGINLFEKKALGVADKVKEALQDAIMQGTKFDMNSVNMQSILEPLTSGLNKIKDIMSGKGPDRISNDIFNGYKQSILDFANALPASIKKSEEFQRALQTLGKEGTVSRKEITDAIDSIIKSTANLNPKNFEEYRKVLEDLLTKTLGTSKAQAIISNINKLQEATNKLPTAANNAKTAYDNFINGIKHIPGTIEKIGKVAGGLGSVAMGITSLVSVFDTIKDPELSGWEKFSSVLMSISMSVAMATNGFKTLSSAYSDITGKILQENIKLEINNILHEINAFSIKKELSEKEKLEAIQTNNNHLTDKENDLLMLNKILTTIGIKEEEKEIVIKKLLNKELTAEELLRQKINKEKLKEIALDKLKNILGILGKIAGLLPIILLALAAIGGAVAWYNNTPEKRLEKAKKVTEEAKEAAEEAKTAYDNLKSTIEDFQGGINKLNELAKGTEEFTQAVQESNEKARELIDTLGLVEGINIDPETGLITFDEGILKQAESQAYLDKQATNARAKAAQIQQNNIENENLIHQFARKNIFGNLSEDSFENAIENGIKNGTFNSQLLDEFYTGKIDGFELAQRLGGTINEPIVQQAFSEENKDEIYALVTALEKNTGSNNLLNDTLANDILLENEDYKNSSRKNDISGFLERENFTISEIQDELINSGKWIDLDLVKEAFNADEVTKTIFGTYKVKIGDEIKKISQEEAAAAVAGIQYIKESGEKVGNAIEKVYSIISTAGENSGLASVFFQEDASAGGDTLANNFRMNSEEFRDDIEAIFNAESEYFINQGYADAEALYQYYVSLFENYDPFAKMENALKNQFASKGYQIDESEFEKISSHVKQWWDGLSDEDKTLAMQIDFTNGEDFNKQLKELKEKAEIDDIYARTAEATGWSEEAIRSYANSLQRTNSLLKGNELLTAKVAETHLNFAKGAQDASEILKEQADILKKADEGSIAYYEAISKLTTSLNQMFGSKVSNDFLKNEKNLKNFEKAVKGDTKAIQELRKTISEDFVMQLDIEGRKEAADAFEFLFNEIAKIEGTHEVEIGTVLDSQGIDAAVSKLNELAQQGKISAEEMNTALNSIGYTGEIEMQTVTTKPKDQDVNFTMDGFSLLGGLINVPSISVHGLLSSDGQTYEFPMLNPDSITKTSTGSSLVSAAKSNPSSSSSGSGGSSSDKKEPKKATEEIERYHMVTRSLDRLTRALEKVSTAKDRAFGKERLRLIDEEIKATDKLVDKQKEYLYQIQGHLTEDQAALAKYGFTFDEFGEITNYIDVYQQQIAKFNSQLTDAAEEQYNEFVKATEQYEETLTLLDEQQMQLQEYLNQLVDLKLEKITTEVEVKIRVNDVELTKLEYFLKKLQREGAATADEIANIAKQIEQVMEKATPIQEAIDKIYEQARAEGRGLNAAETAEIQSFYNDGIIDELEQARMNEIFALADAEDRMLTQAEEDQIQEYKEQLLELNETVWELADSIENKLGEKLEELNGEVQDSINRFSTYTSIFENLKNILTLTNKANTLEGIRTLNQLSASMLKNATSALKANVANYEVFQDLRDAAEEQLASAIAIGDKHMIEYWEDQLTDVTKQMEEAHQNMLASFGDALEAAGDLFDTKVNSMITKLKKNLGDLDTIIDMYDRAKELEELYLSNNQSIYELSKLARDIGKSIDDTTNLIAKNKLGELMKEINGLRAQGVQLSKYDLEYLQAKYDLEVAEIALQEAQEAKSQVKLTRNTEGAWGYVYTADMGKVSEAEQNYEDAMYNMQSLNENYIADYSERLLQNRQAMTEALANIDKTREDYDAEVIRVKEAYMEKEKFYVEELTKAYERSGIQYQDTILGMVSNDESLLESHQNFVEQTETMIYDELFPAYEEWLENTQNICEEAGYSYEELTSGILESISDIDEASSILEENVLNENENMRESMKETMQEIKNWQAQYLETINQMIAANEAYYDKTIADYSNAMEKIIDTAQYALDTIVNAAQSAAAAVATAFDNIPNYEDPPPPPPKENGKIMYGGANFRGVTQYNKVQFFSDFQGNYLYDADPIKSQIKKWNLKQLKTFATGGYTNAWGPEGKLAVLHEKELVLNKQDTSNILSAVDIVRRLNDSISDLWIGRNHLSSDLIFPTNYNGDTLQQDVHIEASFPNVSDRNEIEEAFNNLINTASQYSNRKRI